MGIQSLQAAFLLKDFTQIQHHR